MSQGAVTPGSEQMKPKHTFHISFDFETSEDLWISPQLSEAAVYMYITQRMQELPNEIITNLKVKEFKSNLTEPVAS